LNSRRTLEMSVSVGTVTTKKRSTTKRKISRAASKVESVGQDGLTDKQRVFIEEYLICWNASEAARRAGYSEKTAQQMGSENLLKPVIRQAIDQRLAEKRMSADEVLAQLSAQAGADLADFLSKRGRGVTLDLSKAKAAGKLHLIKKYNKTRQGTLIELYDAQAALVQIGRYHKLFTDKFSGEVSGAIANLTSDEYAKAKSDAEKWEQEHFGEK
jgi:phage terminase small subunit